MDAITISAPSAEIVAGLEADHGDADQRERRAGHLHARQTLAQPEDAQRQAEQDGRARQQRGGAGIHVAHGHEAHVGVDAHEETDGEEEPRVAREGAEAHAAPEEGEDQDGAGRHHVEGARGGREVRQQQAREDVVEAVGDQQQRESEARDGVGAVGAVGH